MKLQIQTPDWQREFLEPHRYKGLKGGRGGGKSHCFAELMIEAHLMDRHTSSVCIRETLKSLKFSSKRLLESKIEQFRVGRYFRILHNEIRHRKGDGLIIFQGMQDHTADSIKSLEDFDRAWADEAQRLSKHSIKLLLPTIRKRGSELWFSWNPENEFDPIERISQDKENFLLRHINFCDNIFVTQETLDEAASDLKNNPDTYGNIWLGEYAVISDAIIFSGKYVVETFTPTDLFSGPYLGLDFGFANDPTAGVKCWIFDNKLFIEKEASKVKLDLDDTTVYFKERIPDIEQYIIRADCARPESISFLKRHGLPRITAVNKWPGSVKDGIDHMRSFDKIIIHPSCVHTIEEFRKYSYKVDRYSGDILPDVVDAYNHLIDSIRYAIDPIIKKKNYSLGAVR